MIGFSVNGKRVDLDVDPSTPLLWVIREHLGLTGTKYVRYRAMRRVHGRYRWRGGTLVGCARIESDGKGGYDNRGTFAGSKPPTAKAPGSNKTYPSMGHCQSGQLMSAAVLLREKPRLTDEDIDQAMTMEEAAVAAELITP
jgi:isoquinoline 1-oxidoreductase alpha subunit